MSNLTEIALIAVYFFPGVVAYLLLDRTIKGREREIVTGVVRGVSVSMNYRRFSLWIYWLIPVAMRLGFCLCLILVYLVMAENLDDAGVQLVVYVFAFYAGIGLLAALVAAVWFFLSLPVLRQAEAN